MVASTKLVSPLLLEAKQPKPPARCMPPGLISVVCEFKFLLIEALASFGVFVSLLSLPTVCNAATVAAAR